MTHAIGTSNSGEQDFPVWGGPADRLRFLLRWAVLAPSRHNAQPWVFEIEGDEVRLYADLSRALTASDPDGRQLVMSCGAALANLRVAAAHFGHGITSEVVSGVRRDGLLARVRLEDRCSSTPEAEEMFQAIPRRRTNRLPLDGREPPEGLVTALLKEARREGVWLRPIEERERTPVAELVAEGDRIQLSSARFRTELAHWVRPNGTPRRDGMPGYALGMSDAAAMLHPLLVRLGGAGREQAERDRRRAITCKALLLLSTPRDGNGEWLAAGEALQRILLRAAARGLYASYFTQPIEIADLRDRLRELLVDPGAPQMMIRLGYGLDVRPVPRRKVGEVLRSFDERRPRPQALALRTPPPLSRAAHADAAHSPLH